MEEEDGGDEGRGEGCEGRAGDDGAADEDDACDGECWERFRGAGDEGWEKALEDEA